MKSRLESLLHQREIIREHLRWLDGEIEVLTHAGSEGNPTPEPVAYRTQEPVSKDVSSPSDLATIPDEVDVRSLHSEVRRGCLLYASIGVLMLGALIGFIYWRY